MFKVGIIGPESCGKSTLARYLAQRHNGVYIEEYARSYIEQLSYPYTEQDVEHIARYQIKQLQSLSDTFSEQTILFFDTELIVTKVWFMHRYGHCPAWLQEALERYKMDVYLICYPDIQWKPDPVRENPAIREFLYDWYIREVEALQIPYYIIRHD